MLFASVLDRCLSSVSLRQCLLAAPPGDCDMPPTIVSATALRWRWLQARLAVLRGRMDATLHELLAAVATVTTANGSGSGSGTVVVRLPHCHFDAVIDDKSVAAARDALLLGSLVMNAVAGLVAAPTALTVCV